MRASSRTITAKREKNTSFHVRRMANRRRHVPKNKTSQSARTFPPMRAANRSAAYMPSCVQNRKTEALRLRQKLFLKKPGHKPLRVKTVDIGRRMNILV